jgi:SM-20-related protein
LIRVAPECGKLVIFLSEDFPHEVLPATQLRQSIAGWFRIKPL